MCTHALRLLSAGGEHKRLHRSQAPLDPARFYTVVLAAGRFFCPDAEPASCLTFVTLTVACCVGLVEEDKGTACHSPLRVTRSRVGVTAEVPKLAVGH